MIVRLCSFLLRLAVVALALIGAAGALAVFVLDRPGAVFWTSDRGTATATEAMWGGAIGALLVLFLYVAVNRLDQYGYPAAAGDTARGRWRRHQVAAGRRSVYDD